MAPKYNYDLAAQLNDGSEVKLNPEEHGWADPDRLSQVKVWSIIPRDSGYPVVTVQIPEEAKPIFKTRVYGKGLPTENNSLTFRAYAIGWHDTKSHWVWVMPGGNIEVGDDPIHADLYLRQILNAATQQ